jgi:hypothetical protein
MKARAFNGCYWWRRFIEGITSNKVLEMQSSCVALGGCTLSIENWAKGLVVKLTEIPHGHWLYINVLVHNETRGVAAAQRKELSQLETKKQIKLGKEGLNEQGYCLLDINMSNLESSSGEHQYYWKRVEYDNTKEKPRQSQAY